MPTYDLLTTGMGSVSILGYDSPISFVFLSHLAPSRNRPFTYTPEGRKGEGERDREEEINIY